MRSCFLAALIIGVCIVAGAGDAVAEKVKAEVLGVEPEEGVAESVTIEFQSKAGRVRRDIDVTSMDNDFRAAIRKGDLVRIAFVCGDDNCLATSGFIIDRTAGDRETFEAGVVVSYAIDTFSADELRNYLNPEDSGDTRGRLTAGFDFQYRLLDRPKLGQSLWIYGETIHGVRSTDIDCQADPELPLCSGFNPADPGEQTLYILRNATSLEAAVGLRWEFRTIKRDTEHPAALYVKLQSGFLAVADGPDDLVDIYHLGFGMMIVDGRFRGSLLEVGAGKNDLFVTDPGGRRRINGILRWRPRFGKFKKDWGVHPYFRMAIDTDFGDGPDSVQSYVGVSFDPDILFGSDPG